MILPVVLSRWFPGPVMQEKTKKCCISKSAAQSFPAHKAKSTSARYWRLRCRPLYRYMISKVQPSDNEIMFWRPEMRTSIPGANWQQAGETNFFTSHDHFLWFLGASQSFCNSSLPYPVFLSSWGLEFPQWHISALSKLLKRVEILEHFDCVLLEVISWLMFCYHPKPCKPDDLSNHGPLLQSKRPPSPMLLAKMSSRHHLGCKMCPASWDRIGAFFEISNAKRQACSDAMPCVLMHHISPFLWLKVHHHSLTQKNVKKNRLGWQGHAKPKVACRQMCAAVFSYYSR